MDTLRALGPGEAAALLPVKEAIEALADGFSRPDNQAPQRMVCEVGENQLLVMPATGGGAVGAKVLTLCQANPGRGKPLIQGIFVLFDEESLDPVLILDGAELTRIRTPAVSALATRYLARENASRLVIFGAGVQARAHLDAMLAVRPIESLAIVEPDRDRAESFAEEARRADLNVMLGEPSVVAEADLVCTCTSCPTPVFDGSRLKPGAHVNAMGSYQSHTREIDDAVVIRGAMFLEDRDAVLAEAGDLIIPLRSGVIDESAIAGVLRDVVARRAGRRTEEEITVFKSVGVAYEDLVIARAVYARMVKE
jgi:ornithine cyclodeaminase